MIFASFTAALGQLGDRRFLKVLVLGVGLALALLVALAWGLFSLVGALVPPVLDLPWIGEIRWARDVLSWGTVPLMLVMSVFLMTPAAAAFSGLFLDEVAEAVEARHYPALPPAPGSSLAEGLRDGLGLMGLMLLVNALALIVYLLAGPFGPLVFWAVNGYLLGREYFVFAAMRRLGRAEAMRLRRRHGATIVAAGILMAAPLSLPLINLVVPVLGAATFTHLFHRIQARDQARDQAAGRP